MNNYLNGFIKEAAKTKDKVDYKGLLAAGLITGIPLAALATHGRYKAFKQNPLLQTYQQSKGINLGLKEALKLGAEAGAIGGIGGVGMDVLLDKLLPQKKDKRSLKDFAITAGKIGLPLFLLGTLAGKLAYRKPYFKQISEMAKTVEKHPVKMWKEYGLAPGDIPYLGWKWAAQKSALPAITGGLAGATVEQFKLPKKLKEIFWKKKKEK